MNIALKNKHIVFSICTIIFSTVLHAQFSVQLTPGLMNYGGDLQNKAYTFQQGGFSIGGALIYRISKFSLRAGFNYGKIKGDDVSNTGYDFRNLSFETKVGEASLSLQYDLFLLDEQHRFTPYVFAGIGAFHFNPYTTYDSQKVYLQPLGTEGQGLPAYPNKKIYSLTEAVIPLGIGLKYKISERIQIGVEFCSRFLFTDYLDDVSGSYADENELFKGRGQLAVDVSYRGDEIDPSKPYPSNEIRGNPKQNDNYYTTSFSLIYVFPESLFSGNGYGGKKGRVVTCPKDVR
ncbi:MAG TPA: DUF6089 family protein [Parafilimonas sp.]|nr:DUF6089 family protein [Parafilimonas sp.]